MTDNELIRDLKNRLRLALQENLRLKRQQREASTRANDLRIENESLRNNRIQDNMQRDPYIKTTQWQYLITKANIIIGPIDDDGLNPLIDFPIFLRSNVGIYDTKHLAELIVKAHNDG